MGSSWQFFRILHHRATCSFSSPVLTQEKQKCPSAQTRTSACGRVALGWQKREAVPMSMSSGVPRLVGGRDAVHPGGGLLLGGWEGRRGRAVRFPLCRALGQANLGGDTADSWSPGPGRWGNGLSFGGSENVQKSTVVTVAQICKYIKSH